MKLTLPQSQSPPAIFSKFARDDFVARDVTVELTLPEFESAFRCVCEPAAEMSMPKAAIDEHGNSLFWKYEIRFAE